MARRRSKTSPLEDFVSLVALLPWWGCLGVGLLSYLGLHRLAQPVVIAGIQPDQVADFMTRTMFQGLAMAGQFVVPLACLVAAGISATKRQQRSGLMASVQGGAPGRASDALGNLSWQDFELSAARRSRSMARASSIEPSASIVNSTVAEPRSFRRGDPAGRSLIGQWERSGRSPISSTVRMQAGRATTVARRQAA